MQGGNHSFSLKKIILLKALRGKALTYSAKRDHFLFFMHIWEIRLKPLLKMWDSFVFVFKHMEITEFSRIDLVILFDTL